LHVIEATIGGTRRHVVDLVGGLARAGVDVGLVAAAEREPAFRGDLARLAAAGVRVHELAMVRSLSPARDYAHLKALEGILARERPDVVHTHSSKAGVLGRLASETRALGRRVHTPHTFAFLFSAMFGPLQRQLFRQIEAALAARSECLIAVSAGEAETMRASGVVDPARVRVVHNGIDPAPWRTARPVQLGLPAGAPAILVAGLLNAAKGQDLAIAALALPGLERAHLLLAGHGEQRAALERQALELGVAGRTHFLGWRDDLPELVAAADLVCVPSRWEALPYVVLEAMAARRPVLATAVDGSRDLVDDSTGALVPPEDPAALAAAAARLLAAESPARAALGERAAERVERGYTLDAMVAKTRAIYAEVA
jgi:glycosyltransferase involved in cell wall biosynthesis